MEFVGSYVVRKGKVSDNGKTEKLLHVPDEAEGKYLLYADPMLLTLEFRKVEQ